MFESEFVSPENLQTYQNLIHRAAETLVGALPNQPYSGRTPSELETLISTDLLPGSPLTVDQLLAKVKTIVANSINVSHPNTIAHLHCPPLLSSLAAEVVISALNQSMDSFDQAPVPTILEQRMIRWLCNEAGFSPAADGTFTTGGSQSNYMGLLLARDACLKKHWNWNTQKSGLPVEAKRLRILCSEVAHFTVEKSAAQLGLGTDAVVRVGVDDQFRMNLVELHEVLASLAANSLLPMAIVGTAGTTDFGSIDPLPEVAAIARQSGTWLHVDAAYGGALLFSDRYRSKLTAIDQADSVSIDFHKLLWQPIPCSAFLLRDARNFDFIQMHADYLNPEAHDDEGIPNLVTTSLLTSRRFDALKLWISLQSLGRPKLAAMIDRTVELAEHAAKVVRGNPSFQLLSQPQLSTVVFRFIPQKGDADGINSSISQSLFGDGRAVIGHTRVHGHQCLKFTCMNPATREDQIEEVIRLVLDYGNRLDQS